ncbi:TetR/AcrR family transcriptional regulator [Cryobacterium melibiosiphilum]|uniref:TetR/AcrR family transcriptional regulator n=1 Tax=Cryobacterium melibiosiphilum TaxID=995039 RepID=A0A3A5M911_9MICO|nr:TetR/AcrR family transcriptional regulator [Cryobacterium melibiosiphilum]RJT85724.1 TetR/AcrR family transcriptional regulator [Cryobacterium melibiosiphilum]
MVASEITQTAAGRRERNKRDKQQRIFAAASELFAAHGYAAVTTQQIAERADVAGGTLFRYAATKAELLLMVCNEDFRVGLAAGRTALPAAGTPGERMLALVTPLIGAGRQNDENTTAYQREVLFGEPHERYRAEALELARELQSLFAAVLADAWDAAGASASRPRPDPTLAARTASDVLHLELARAGLFGTPTPRLQGELRAQFTLIAHGFLHSPHDDSPQPD